MSSTPALSPADAALFIADAYARADWLARVHAPAWVEAADLPALADHLRGLIPVTSVASAQDAYAELEDAISVMRSDFFANGWPLRNAYVGTFPGDPTAPATGRPPGVGAGPARSALRLTHRALPHGLRDAARLADAETAQYARALAVRRELAAGRDPSFLVEQVLADLRATAPDTISDEV